MCFGKRKPGAIWLSTYKIVFQILIICEWATNLKPKNLKIQYSLNNHNLECFYLVIQVGSSGMNNVFGLLPTIVTWNSKLTSLLEPFWSHRGDENFKIFTWIQDLPHPRWFVPYMKRTRIILCDYTCGKEILCIVKTGQRFRQWEQL